MLAQLARESATWEPAGPKPANHRWWRDGGRDRVSQWEHIKRPAALRAIILYPLNALVEDQLRRLRSTLDHEKVHHWLDLNRGGNRITFGRYTGLTPVAGNPNNSSKFRQLRDALKNMDTEYQQNLSALAPPDMDDKRWYFPNPDGSEMWSRWDMQDTPPDILITNYSMLNIMLMRNIETTIFEQTRAWLAEPDHPERVFHLIIDELHAYRGTPGTEVAYIVRLLLHRLGLDPDSPKLRILTTTASIEDSSEGRDFLRQFFGRDPKRFKVISGAQTPPKSGSHTELSPYATAFANFANATQPDPRNPMAPLDTTTNQVRTATETLCSQLGSGSNTGHKDEARLGLALKDISASDALREACMVVDKQRGGQGIVRPARVTDLDKVLFPGISPVDDTMFSDAMRGFLLALGIAQDPEIGRTPQPVRGHYFFHNLQNLWACTNPHCTDSSCSGRSNDHTVPIGALYNTHRLSCSCGSRVLDLLICEVCGEVFLGGYKSPNGTESFHTLTPDQPDLENVPDRVVLQRTYHDYAIFWPLPHTPSKQPGHPDWTVDKLKRKWVRAKLDPATGILRVDKKAAKDSEIQGWVYVIGSKSKQVEREPAYPTCCPNCDADYRYRTNNRSPLRNHRTGFAKACQVIVGGVVREMPNTDDKEKSSRKLVVFSDSRQDAAKLAAGMTRDHHRDLVRMALTQSLDEYWGDLVNYLQAYAERGQTPASLQTLNPTLHNDIITASQPADAYRRQRFATRTNSAIMQEAGEWRADMPPLNKAARQEWMTMLQTYPGPVPLAHLRDIIADLLLNLGVNYAGATYKVSQYKQDKERKPWFECYDWNNEPIVPQVPAQSGQSGHITDMKSELMRELMYAVFPHAARTLEGLAQGWVTYQPVGLVSETLKQATDATIRLLGTHRRHKYARFTVSGNDDELPRFVQNYLEPNGISSRDVQKELLTSGAAEASGRGLVLNPDKLYIIRPKNRDQGYRCPECNAFYLHPAMGVCPECITVKLAESTPSKDFDYYVYLAGDSGDPFRMNAEELTGQTDKATRPNRQRWFQDIFIDNEIPRVQGVDLLSVTTTMEAGVDIGSLLATMMANMPPRRFNYQQRVGRAGRRSTGVSLAVTFCRGRSHDDFYYQRPEKITGDPPPPPYVDMDSATILRRVMIKEILRLAFTQLGLTVGTDEQKAPSVHGEFGDAENWPDYVNQVQTWLDDTGNESQINAVLDALLPQTTLVSNATFRQEIFSYLRNELCQQITDIVSNPSYTQDALSERLANAGLLPMFGFPTRVRQLYTQWPFRAESWPPEKDIVDRNLDIALSQFAPGSQTVKDKAVHTACGVVELRPAGGNQIQSNPGLYPPLTEDNPLPIGRCENCYAVTYLENQPIAPPVSDTDLQIQTCPVCKADAMVIIDAREPKDFFTDLSPDDFEGRFEWTPRSTRPSIGFKAKGASQTFANVEVGHLYDDITSINDNGGAGGFDFFDTTVYGKDRAGAYTIALDAEKNKYVQSKGQGHRIALLSRRKTDILLVRIQKWPDGVFADPVTVEGRAAWYSFAFWLGTAASVHLDIDPTELQAGIRTILANHNPAGEAFLCDQLENGAGYCSFLSTPAEFQQLLEYADLASPKSIAKEWLNPNHAEECDTSCNFCLREYNNLPYHSLLDWRLALDMVRIARHGTAPDLVSKWATEPNPWTNSLDGAIPNTLARLGYGPQETFGSLRGYVSQGKRKQVLIEVHPLWTTEHPQYQQARDAAKKLYPNHNVSRLNPFRALRRPADYVTPKDE